MDKDNILEKGMFTFYRQQLEFQEALQRGDHIKQAKSTFQKSKILKRYQLKRKKSREVYLQQNRIAPIRLYRFENKKNKKQANHTKLLNIMEQRRLTFSLLNKKQQQQKNNHKSQFQIVQKDQQGTVSGGSYLQNKQFPFFQQIDSNLKINFESEQPLSYKASLQVMRQIKNNKKQKQFRSQSNSMKYHSHEHKIRQNAKSIQLIQGQKLPLIQIGYKKIQNRYVVKKLKNTKNEQKIKPQPIEKIKASFERKIQTQIGINKQLMYHRKSDYQQKANQRKKLIQMLRKFKQNL